MKNKKSKANRDLAYSGLRGALRLTNSRVAELEIRIEKLELKSKIDGMGE